MVHEYQIKGVPMKTGDIICTVDGSSKGIAGLIWSLIGKGIPGEVDHIVVYLGPGAKCIEANVKGIVEFEANPAWDAEAMFDHRFIMDKFYGVANPLMVRGMTEEQEQKAREDIAEYCRAQLGKPYNINFFLSKLGNSFYCSQLAYKAYLELGIDLNTNKGGWLLRQLGSVIFPQEIWNECEEDGCARRA